MPAPLPADEEARQATLDAYRILDTGVINIRKFTAYQVAASATA